ncbi:MAG: TetR/AcrR family transcriptional regulator [Myxococcota bacterium]
MAKRSKSTRSRGRPRKFDESEVLDAITDLFWQRGLSGTSLDALSAATGVARPSLYATFGDKEQMYLAGLRNFFGRIDASISPVLEEAASLDESLRGIFEVLIELYVDHEDIARGCLIMSTAATEASGSERIREELGRLLDGIDARFAQVLQRGREHGELDPDADVEALASVLAGVTHSLSVRARAGAERSQLEQLADAAVAVVPYA